MKRLVALLPVLIALQAGVPPALAWTWPVDGPVLRPFVLGDDPYAAGQHRGIDIGAVAGAPVRAPAAGAVTFAGTVPGGGRTVTIQTSDGYSVTLVHLGSFGVGRGGAVVEGSTVGTVGPSGEPELAEPYVHLGVRRTADEHGYVDPLALLPAVTSEPPPEAGSPAEDPAPDQPAKSAPPAGPPASEQSEEGSEGMRSGTGAPAAKAEEAARGPASAPARTTRSRGRSTRLTHGRAAALPVGAEAGAGVRSLRAPALPPRTRRASFEPVGLPTSRAPRLASPGREDARKARVAAGLAVLLVLVGGVCLGVRRRQLRDAVSTDRASSVLLHRVRPAAEDASRLRSAQEDRLVLDGDLERVLLGQAEALADLDRDDDPAELVDVADDARALRSSSGAQPCAHGNRSLRSPRRRAASLRRPRPYRRSPVDSHSLPFQTATRESRARPSV
jgi:hypothetical protein